MTETIFKQQLIEIQQYLRQYKFRFTDLTQKLIRTLFKYYNEHPDDKSLPCSVDFFSSEKIHQLFIERYKHLLFEKNESIYFNNDISSLLIRKFRQVKNNERFRVPFSEERQEEEDSDIPSVYTAKKWMQMKIEEEHMGLNIFPRKAREILSSYDENDVVVDDDVKLSSIITLHNKNPQYVIQSNPCIFTKEYTSSSIIDFNLNRGFIKTKLYVRRLVTKSKHLVTKYRFMCPKCNSPVYVLPYKMNSQIFHVGCGVDKKGNPINTPIEKSVHTSQYGIPLYIYEAKININDKENIYIYSKDKNLSHTYYEMELILDHIRLEYGDKPINMLFVLNKRDVILEGSSDMIIEGSGEQIEKKLLLPRMKLNDIRQSIIDFYSSNNETITNEGMFLQYSILISGLGKLLFGYNKLGISVMGNKSLSKTYPTTRFGPFLDKEYYFSQNADDISVPGLKGGIGHLNINGTVTRQFMDGIITRAGLCVFDEGSKFFIDTTMNNHLKSIPQREIKIDKIDGGVTEQNYTPIIFSNFTDFFNKYKNDIIETYYELMKIKEPSTKKSTMVRELANTDFLLPLSYYRESYELQKAIAVVRNNMEANNIDWKTGGRIECSNRLLFDVVVANQDCDVVSDTSYTTISSPETRYLPVDRWQRNVLKICGNPTIRLLDFERNNNSESDKQQLDMLISSIKEWLDTDGNDIVMYFSKGCGGIDPKLKHFIYSSILIVELIEHPKSTTISENTKYFMKILLLKCKRGVSKQEYDFEINILQFDEVDIKGINLNETKIDLKEYKEERVIEEAKKKIREEEKEENVDEYMSDRIDEYLNKLNSQG